MSSSKIPLRLSPTAFEELRQIAQAEYGKAMSDDEINDMGVRLLKLFRILGTQDPEQKTIEYSISVSSQEFKALKYLHHAIYHNHVSPSVRDITQALGYRSSRSGFRILNHLIDRGLVYRNEEGDLRLKEDVRECQPKLDVKS